LVAAGNRLVGSFQVIEAHVTLIDFPGTAQVSGLFNQLAFIFEIAMIAFNEWVLVWSVRRTDTRFNSQTLEKA
jgi:hypothetical protein